MELKQRLLSDTKEAMRAKDSLRLNTLRLLSSEIKNHEIDQKKELDEASLLSLVVGQIKKRKEAVEMYTKANRLDLAEKEQSEISVLEHYLPEQVSEEEVRSRVLAVIEETGACGPKDMGKVMKILVPEFKGKADGNLIKTLVSESLAKNA